MAGFLPIEIDRYVQTYPTFRFVGVDLTDADLVMHVRLYADAPGVPLRAFASGDGLTLQSVAFEGSVPTSIVRLAVPAEVFPYSADRSADLRLAYDLLVKISADVERERWLFGPFIILAGVTQHG